MHVVESGDFSSLQQLVDRGSDVNAGDKMGATALMKAAEMGRIEMVELLLSKGADLKVVDQGGTTALQRASPERGNK
jgi:ankyrin repeat protein